MFGKADVDDDDQPSEDEEWGPGRGRRRGRAEAVNGGVKPDTNGAETGKEMAKEPKRRNRRKSTSAQVANGQQALSGQQSDDGKTYRRLPDNAVEVKKLSSFKEICTNASYWSVCQVRTQEEDVKLIM